VSNGNQLRADFGKKLHINDIIEYDTFKEYIYNKYIDIGPDFDILDSDLNHPGGGDSNVKDPSIKTSTQNYYSVR
jgi:hypothetical protein